MPRSFFSLIVWLQISILTGSLSGQSCRNSIWETTCQSHARLCWHKRLFALVLISPTPPHLMCLRTHCSDFLLSCSVGMDRIKQENLFFRRHPQYGLLDRKWGGSGSKESCGGRQGNNTLGPAITLVLQKQICVPLALLQSRQEALQGCLGKLRFQTVETITKTAAPGWACDHVTRPTSRGFNMLNVSAHSCWKLVFQTNPSPSNTTEHSAVLVLQLRFSGDEFALESPICISFSVSHLKTFIFFTLGIVSCIISKLGFVFSLSNQLCFVCISFFSF